MSISTKRKIFVAPEFTPLPCATLTSAVCEPSWKKHCASPDEVRERCQAFARAWEKAGRDPASFRFSVMATVLIGADEEDFRDRAARLAERRRQDVGTLLDSLAGTGVVGTIDQAVERLRELERAGAQRVMLQHHLHDDLEAVELMGRELIPRIDSG